MLHSYMDTVNQNPLIMKTEHNLNYDFDYLGALSEILNIEKIRTLLL